MKKAFAIFTVSSLICLAVGCASISSGTYKHRKMTHKLLDGQTFDVTAYSSDSTYGFTEENPIMVGGVQSGPLNERRFLNALSGPKGEKVFYEREGSCCHFKSERGYGGVGLLDVYLVQYITRMEETIQRKIYINMYDTDSLKIPVGFTKKEYNNDNPLYYSGY